MSKREEELEKRVRDLEDALSTMFNVWDGFSDFLCPEDMDWIREDVMDARSVWLRQGEIEDDYDP